MKLVRFFKTFVIVLVASSMHASDPPARPALSFEKITGGTDYDRGTAVAVDAAGSVYITGNTTSVDFPVKNPFQPTIGGVPLRSSADRGKTWTAPAIGSPVLTVVASAKQTGTFYAGTFNGVYKSPDSGKTWAALGSGPKFQVNAIVIDSSNPLVIYSGGGDGVLKSQDGGLTWRVSRGQSSSGETVIGLIAHPLRASTIFAATSLGGLPRAPALYRSTDAGATWSLLSNSPVGVFALAIDPSNPDTLYAGASPGSSASAAIYKTMDGGNTWAKLSAVKLALSNQAIATSQTTMYAATVGGILRSRDGGTTWTPTSLTALADTVTVDPGNPQLVYANAGGVYVSVDGGDTWSPILPIRQYLETISLVPTTPSIVFVGAATGQNAFVSKWSADGKQLLYSTYLGGSYADFPTSIAVDTQGNAYITGYTFSDDFPITSGALQSKNKGNYNVFFSKISADGSTLEYSTYLGGSTGDGASALAVDKGGNAYITGFAGSADFPITMNAAQGSLKQNCSLPAVGTATRPTLGDAFVAKINTAAASLVYSTYIGGTCADEAFGIAIDALGSAFIVGATTSIDFPVTPDALQRTYTGAAFTGFLTKLNPQGSGIAYATYLGGPGSDSANGISLDDQNAIYITGTSNGVRSDPVWVPVVRGGYHKRREHVSYVGIIPAV